MTLYHNQANFMWLILLSVTKYQYHCLPYAGSSLYEILLICIFHEMIILSYHIIGDYEEKIGSTIP
jgi:hypothetical protein